MMGLSQAGEGMVGVVLILRPLGLTRGQNSLGRNSRCHISPARRTKPRGDVGGQAGTSNGFSCQDPHLGSPGCNDRSQSCSQESEGGGVVISWC